MSVRNWKRAAVWFMLPALVLLCCTGCKKKEQDTFAELRLEDGSSGSTEKKEAEEIGKSEERTSGTKDPGTEKQSMPGTETSGELSGDQEPELVFVHVCGAVVSPGVYGMDADARVYEAVSCAGGLREDAAGEAVNQAQKVTDGERIYIPTREEVVNGLIPEAEEDTETAVESMEESGGAQTGSTDGKVNINTASEEELKTLSGIGDTRAESIIRYWEEQGGFQSVEDLMNVEGIKEGVFEKIKERITVNTGS